MLLPRLAPANTHKIWQPRWHDRVVLIAKHKVGTHNLIKFTKAPTMQGEWYLSNTTIAKYPIEQMPTKSGGTMAVYAIPIDELIVFEGRRDD